MGSVVEKWALKRNRHHQPTRIYHHLPSIYYYYLRNMTCRIGKYRFQSRLRVVHKISTLQVDLFPSTLTMRCYTLLAAHSAVESGNGVRHNDVTAMGSPLKRLISNFNVVKSKIKSIVNLDRAMSWDASCSVIPCSVIDHCNFWRVIIARLLSVKHAICQLLRKIKASKHREKSTLPQKPRIRDYCIYHRRKKTK